MADPKKRIPSLEEYLEQQKQEQSKIAIQDTGTEVRSGEGEKTDTAVIEIVTVSQL